jgi:hypothetical protein
MVSCNMKEYGEQLHKNIKARLHVEHRPQGSYIYG